MPYSPAVTSPKVADDVSIYTEGETAAARELRPVAEILRVLTQIDHAAGTRFDSNRCGPTVLFAAAINKVLSHCPASPLMLLTLMSLLRPRAGSRRSSAARRRRRQHL